MKLELGQLIIDTTAGCQDTGVVIRVDTCDYGEPLYEIFWVCPRDKSEGYRGDYTTTLAYTEEELDMEYSHCFEVIR